MWALKRPLILHKECNGFRLESDIQILSLTTICETRKTYLSVHSLEPILLLFFCSFLGGGQQRVRSPYTGYIMKKWDHLRFFIKLIFNFFLKFQILLIIYGCLLKCFEVERK